MNRRQVVDVCWQLKASKLCQHSKLQSSSDKINNNVEARNQCDSRNKLFEKPHLCLWAGTSESGREETAEFRSDTGWTCTNKQFPFLLKKKDENKKNQNVKHLHEIKSKNARGFIEIKPASKFKIWNMTLIEQEQVTGHNNFIT